MSERFWPLAEAAQADYEALRAAALRARRRETNSPRRGLRGAGWLA